MRNRAVRGCLTAIVLAIIAATVVHSKEAHRHSPKKLSEQQTNPPDNQKPSITDKRGTFELPLVVKPLATEKNQQESENDARERNDKRWNDRATLVIAFGTLLILVVQTGVFGLQAIRLQQTIKKMDDIGRGQSADMQASIAVAKETADAAILSAKVAELGLVGTEAPFIFAIVDFSVIELPDSRKRNARYTLRNFGRSPAIVREIYHACIASAEVPDPVPFPPLQTPILKVEIIAARESGEAHQLSEFKSLRENGNSEPIFVVGQARYADIFGNQYLTGFCYFLNEHAGTCYAIGGTAHNYRRKLSNDEASEAEARDTPRTIPRKES